jgi:hypothetical protein
LAAAARARHARQNACTHPSGSAISSATVSAQITHTLQVGSVPNNCEWRSPHGAQAACGSSGRCAWQADNDRAIGKRKPYSQPVAAGYRFAKETIRCKRWSLDENFNIRVCCCAHPCVRSARRGSRRGPPPPRRRTKSTPSTPHSLRDRAAAVGTVSLRLGQRWEIPCWMVWIKGLKGFFSLSDEKRKRAAIDLELASERFCSMRRNTERTGAPPTNTKNFQRIFTNPIFRAVPSAVLFELS